MTPKQFGQLAPDEKMFYDIQFQIMWQDYKRKKEQK